MLDYYVNKIKSEAINRKTNKPWTVEDVPVLWREEVRKVLK